MTVLNIKARYIYLYTILSLIKEISLILNQLESETLQQVEEMEDDGQTNLFE